MDFSVFFSVLSFFFRTFAPEIKKKHHDEGSNRQV